MIPFPPTETSVLTSTQTPVSGSVFNSALLYHVGPPIHRLPPQRRPPPLPSEFTFAKPVETVVRRLQMSLHLSVGVLQFFDSARFVVVFFAEKVARFLAPRLQHAGLESGQLSGVRATRIQMVLSVRKNDSE